MSSSANQKKYKPCMFDADGKFSPVYQNKHSLWTIGVDDDNDNEGLWIAEL